MHEVKIKLPTPDEPVASKEKNAWDVQSALAERQQQEQDFHENFARLRAARRARQNS